MTSCSCNICVGWCDAGLSWAGLGWLGWLRSLAKLTLLESSQKYLGWVETEEFSALTSGWSHGGGYCPSHTTSHQSDGSMSHVANEVPNPGIVVSAIIRRKRKFVTNAKNFWVSFLLRLHWWVVRVRHRRSGGRLAARWRPAPALSTHHWPGMAEAHWRICFKSQPKCVWEIQTFGKIGWQFLKNWGKHTSSSQ